MERRAGKIINISSIAAKRDPQIVPAYAAGKNALLTLTRIVAKDLAPYNINVNAICPGMVWGTLLEAPGASGGRRRALLCRDGAPRAL